jgi:glutamate/tyrosine decarboxylase-like PLP-dependent enzyme
MVSPSLQVPVAGRIPLWEALVAEIERYARDVSALPVSPDLDAAAIRKHLSVFDFEQPVEPAAAVRIAAEGLTRWQVHTAHPRYFGLFNPAPTTMGIAADTLVAAFNPQMAAWSHNPFAAETEMHLIRALGRKFGYDPACLDGTFCSGGMEANHTAVLCALARHFPEFARLGVRALARQPVLYASAESHHSFLKAARLTGLGMDAVRLIGTDEKLRMRPDLTRQAIAADRAAGNAPFLIAATAGTTSAGVVDPLRELAAVAHEEGLWLHTDAAWGGAAALVPELRASVDGLEMADSLTFDAHKWLSVPMGAGLYITRDMEVLTDTFRVATAYMPKDAAGMDVVDPHLHSMQWSRRFIGLKVFLSLLTAGWAGYEHAIRHQTAMGNLLRERLRADGWAIVNETPLPLVCFADSGGDADTQRAIASDVVRSGAAWISPTVIGGRTVMRACITHYGTAPEDVAALVEALRQARER